MKKTILILSLFMVFSLLLVSAGNIRMGSIRFLEDNDYAKTGFTLHVNLDNRESMTEAKNVKMKFVVMDDTSIYSATNGNDIMGNDIQSRMIYTPFEYYDNLECGEYYVRIYAYGDNGVRRIKHRPINIC